MLWWAKGHTARLGRYVSSDRQPPRGRGRRRVLWTARGSVKAGLAQRSWPASHQRARSGHCTARASTVLILAFFFHNTNDSHGDDVLPRLPARPLIGRPGVQAPPSQKLVGRRGAGCSYATGRRETGHRQAQRCRAKCARKGHGRLAPFLLAAEPSPRVLTGGEMQCSLVRCVSPKTRTIAAHARHSRSR